MSFVPV